MNFDFKNMQTYQWFVIIGAGVAVLALLLYFLKGARVKLPAIVAASLGSLAVGVGAGVMLLGALGYNWNEKPRESGEQEQAQGGPPGGGGMPKMGGPPGMPKMGGPPGKGGGNQAVAKPQLVSLINKLNLLTEKPLAVSLNADKKKKIDEQIKDLGTLDDLTEDEAKKRVEAIHEVVKDDRATLEAAGYRWTTGKGGGGGFGGGKSAPNPFKGGNDAKALQGLQERVEK
jgi:hypothetical protein